MPLFAFDFRHYFAFIFSIILLIRAIIYFAIIAIAIIADIFISFDAMMPLRHFIIAFRYYPLIRRYYFIIFAWLLPLLISLLIFR
jgi:hypothetical protein